MALDEESQKDQDLDQALTAFILLMYDRAYARGHSDGRNSRNEP